MKDSTGTLTANASGVSYAWNTGDTTQSINVSDDSTYTVTVTNILTGCRNFASGNLIVNDSTSGELTEMACDSLMINGVTYISSGTYTQHSQMQPDVTVHLR